MMNSSTPFTFRSLRLLPAALVAAILVSCGSYEQATYNDGIYGDERNASYGEQPVQSSPSSTSYSQYFSDVADQYGEVEGEATVITDVESYSTAGNGPVNGAWGEQVDDVTVNVYNTGGIGAWGYGFANFGYFRPRFYNPYWGSYQGFGWGGGWNNFGVWGSPYIGAGFGWGGWGWNNGFGPGFGFGFGNPYWGGGFYNPYWNGYRYGNSYAYANGYRNGRSGIYGRSNYNLGRSNNVGRAGRTYGRTGRNSTVRPRSTRPGARPSTTRPGAQRPRTTRPGAQAKPRTTRPSAGTSRPRTTRPRTTRPSTQSRPSYRGGSSRSGRSSGMRSSGGSRSSGISRGGSRRGGRN